MLHIVFAAAAAIAPAQVAEVRGQIKSSCETSLKTPGTDVPKGFCACFSKAAAPEIAGLATQDRTIFLYLTENAGDPVAAQRLANKNLNMTVETFAAVWDRLNPIGQKAGAGCSKAK